MLLNMEIDKDSEWNTLSEDFANFTHSSGESVGIYLVDVAATTAMGVAVEKAIAALQGIWPMPIRLHLFPEGLLFFFCLFL